ncbi:MAG: iron-containing redox enzyme family protein, partial [Methylococcaceae bacterium]|nr:iron-containing redox enzyme family protein [Methylococcaceae bacterium]
QFIDQQHRKELERYRPLTAPPRVDRDYCRWAVLQLAPAILLDGTWLAGIPSAAEKLDETRRHLLKIYADELGYGRAEWNHPNVYRRLLASLGYDLPASDTEAFARHPAFVDAAFDLPVYLMAIGLMNDHYFPELLGLNLAIELSGLGAPYLRAIDILRHHGMDPTILQLHLSIDNLASGHAARARDAIELYLEEIRQREGPVAMRAAWDRIWQGYNTLRLASLSITLSIAGRYGLHRLGLKISPQIESGSANTSSGAS